MMMSAELGDLDLSSRQKLGTFSLLDSLTIHINVFKPNINGLGYGE